jgi:hypothetical protein
MRVHVSRSQTPTLSTLTVPALVDVTHSPADCRAKPTVRAYALPKQVDAEDVGHGLHGAFWRSSSLGKGTNTRRVNRPMPPFLYTSAMRPMSTIDLSSFVYNPPGAASGTSSRRGRHHHHHPGTGPASRGEGTA